MARCILQVVVPSPLRRVFDYWAPADKSTPLPGTRVRVPFGKAQHIGVVVGATQESRIDAKRLRPITEILDERPCLPSATLALLEWAATYYHHPLGEVIFSALPALLRQGRPDTLRALQRWRATAAGKAVNLASLKRAPRQAALLSYLREQSEAIGPEALAEYSTGWSRAMGALQKKAWVEAIEIPCLGTASEPSRPAFDPSPAQREAIDKITEAFGAFKSILLQGITGSGKTEVYLQAIEQSVAKGYQALLLIPEIGLTPQMVKRFRRRFGFPVAVLHSGLSDTERLCAWTMARDGKVPVVIGTRSAVFVPLKTPGIVVVDEEHDLSYKQQEGFRYSARDLALVRARQHNIPVVLGSATPSLESLHNLSLGRYQSIALPERAKGRPQPTLRVIDVRGQRLISGCSQPLLSAIASVMGKGQQVLLFLNRRGYAPTLMCHDCGWLAHCQRCDANLTIHRNSHRLRCHHCGAERPIVLVCPACGSEELLALGSGTERLEATLKDSFPHARIARVDRDSTRRKGAMEEVLHKIHAGETDVLIGTQMVAKGHHFPNVTLVAVIDADGGLFSTDFRAAERLAQLIVQVAGRAGRGEHAGEVLIQTHHPEHPLLRALLVTGYERFAEQVLAERRHAALPPFVSMALLRAEAPDRAAVLAFLEDAGALARPMAGDGKEVLGPAPAPMERRSGRFRAQLLLQSATRTELHRLLDQWLPQVEALRGARRVRWSLDVDPQELT